MCEEFPAYGPVEAYRAWLNAPVGLFEEIIEARGFARTRELVDSAKNDKDLPRTRWVALVKEVMAAAAEEDLELRTEASAGE